MDINQMKAVGDPIQVSPDDIDDIMTMLRDGQHLRFEEKDGKLQMQIVETTTTGKEDEPDTKQ